MDLEDSYNLFKQMFDVAKTHLDRIALKRMSQTTSKLKNSNEFLSPSSQDR